MTALKQIQYSRFVWELYHVAHKDAGAFHVLEAKLTQVEFGKSARYHNIQTVHATIHNQENKTA